MKFAFIGAGKMASAIIKGMLANDVCSKEEIIAACPDEGLLKSLIESTGIRAIKSNADAVAAAPVAILCVKPQDAVSALSQCGDCLNGKLLISIAAGLAIDSLRKMAPACRVVRAMPNTPAIVGKAATAFACGADCEPADVETAHRIFGGIGEVYPVEEKLIDAVTGVSGSGPAYVFLMMEALADGGVACGLPASLARQLAMQTLLGAAELAKETGEHPAVLREMVTSPGGTTAAALGVLENRGVRAAFIDAVRAAEQRSKELARE